MSLCKRIAMWSGPRNISTALMRSWGSRSDTFVCDEPFYAHYLLTTAMVTHPGYVETISNHQTEWHKVVDWITGPIPEGKAIFYQKHMAHHVLPDRDLSWIDSIINCLLIREPREMLTSLLEFLPEPRLNDTGLSHQMWLFEHIQETNGEPPLVLDARDVLDQPRRMLTLLCERVGVRFDERMLTWEPGLRPTDGAWAPHWYAKVTKTRTFGTYKHKDDEVPQSLLPLLAECEEIYHRLYRYRLR